MTSASNQSTYQKHARSDCPLAIGLDVIGDRWSLLVIRDLMFFAEREFGQILAADERISTNILTDRLNRLAGAGLISKHPHPTHGRKSIYRLTEDGLNLAPVIVELIIWSTQKFGDDKVPEIMKHRLANDKQGLIAKFRSGQPLDFGS